MLMFTTEELTARDKATIQKDREAIAAMLRKKADDHPKWEVHDLLKALADSIERPN